MYSKPELKQLKNSIADTRHTQERFAPCPLNQWISRKYFCLPVMGLV